MIQVKPKLSFVRNVLFPDCVEQISMQHSHFITQWRATIGSVIANMFQFLQMYEPSGKEQNMSVKSQDTQLIVENFSWTYMS